MDNINKSIAGRLKILRGLSQFSQTTVAEKLSITQGAYSLIESGKIRINVEQLVRLSKLYNISTDFILKGEEFISKE